MYIVLMVLKWMRIPFVEKVTLKDPKKSAFWLGERIKKERDNLLWLVNNITLRCFSVIVILYCFLLVIESTLGSFFSWGLFINYLTFHLGATKGGRA